MEKDTSFHAPFVMTEHFGSKISGGFRGQVGASATLHDENAALAPPFWQEKRPLSRPKCTLFSVICSKCGETYKLRRYSVEKAENFLE